MDKVSGLVCALLMAVSPLLWGQNDANLFPPKPVPAVFVHDYSGWLQPGEKAQLEYKLARYSDSTSTQIVVMIRPDIGDYDRSSYAFELGNRWGIGRKDKNNGILILVKTEQPQRGIFIATGTGTEGRLNDGKAGEIIRAVIAPYFRTNQYFAGLDKGTDAIIGTLAGEFQPNAADKRGAPMPLGIFILILVLMMAFFMFMASRMRKQSYYTHDDQGYRRRTVHRNDGWGGGGWWIGGGGGGSGWGGGGDSDGGGWGGGGDFGGGDFGGGGAGGDW